jgi:hypothetical protein
LYGGFIKWLRYETLIRVRKEKITKKVGCGGGIFFENGLLTKSGSGMN